MTRTFTIAIAAVLTICMQAQYGQSASINNRALLHFVWVAE